MKLFTDKMLFPNNSVMAEANVDKIYNEDDPYFTTVRQIHFFKYRKV